MLPEEKTPLWLKKYTAFIVKYMEFERKKLPSELVHGGLVTTFEDAEHEAYGVFQNRLLSLAVTLDKVQYVLSHQNAKHEAPIRILSKPEIINNLYTDQNSFMRCLLVMMKM